MTEGPLPLDPAALSVLVPSRIARAERAIADDAPACPLCGSQTERRTARSGPRAGIDFWGCTASPLCRGRLDIGGTYGRPISGHAVDPTTSPDAGELVALQAFLAPAGGDAGTTARTDDATSARTDDGVLQPSRQVRSPAPKPTNGRTGSTEDAVGSGAKPRTGLGARRRGVSASPENVVALPPAPIVAIDPLDAPWWIAPSAKGQPATDASEPVARPLAAAASVSEAAPTEDVAPVAEIAEGAVAEIAEAAVTESTAVAAEPVGAVAGTEDPTAESVLTPESDQADPGPPVDSVRPPLAVAAAGVAGAMTAADGPDASPIARGLAPDADALRRIGLWPIDSSQDGHATLPTMAPASSAAPQLLGDVAVVPGSAAALPPAVPSVAIGSAAAFVGPHPPQSGNGTRAHLRTAARHGVDGIARAAAAAGDLVRPRAQHAVARLVDSALDVVHPSSPPVFVGGRDVAGASAQVEFEQRRARHRSRMRAALPVVVGVTMIAMTMTFAILASRGVLLAGFGTVTVGALGLWGISRLPGEALAWGRDAADERRTAEYLDELLPMGYVILHDRVVPGVRVKVDHIAVGPAGVFVIETKNLRGRLTIAGEKVFVGDRSREGAIDETYREALAVQVSLSERLNALRNTVRPVLCLHRTAQLLLDNEVRGVRVVSGPQLVRYVRRLPALLDAETVQELASLADSRLLPAIP